MTTLIQRSLASGEISPALHQRVDLQKYTNGLRTLRNCYVKKGGGAENRAGTTYVYGAPDPDTDPRQDYGITPIGENTRLFGWISPESSDSYVLEFGDGFIRFTKNGARIDVGSVGDWSSATAYIVGDLVSYQGTFYYCTFPHTNQTPSASIYWYVLEGYEYSIPTPWYSANGDSVLDCCFAQDSSFVLITHPNTLPQILVRESDTRWMIYEWVTQLDSFSTYGHPRIQPPTSLGHSGGTGSDQYWAVTAITEDLEESLPAFKNGAGAATANPVTISWTASVFAPQSQARPAQTGTIKGYNVYKRYAGVYFYLGFASGTSYVDDASIVPSADGDSPPERRVELRNTATVAYPSKCGVFQQRTLLGNFPFNVQAVYASRTGFPENFTRRFPSADDDSILFQVKGKQPSAVRHFVDIGDLIVLASNGEWIVPGNANGVLTPSPPPVPKQFSANGAKDDVSPVVVGSRAVYVQEQGSVIRSVGFDNQYGGKDGYSDDDLTAFADHLFEGKTIVSMAYQKTPHSIVWCVRSDGVLLGCTYIREQEILAWHRHDTDGLIEEVCSVPESGGHALYMIVKRSINGQDFRYLERLNDRVIGDIVDSVFLDCALSYDGRNTNTSHTMMLTGGSAWDNSETLTLTSSQVFFSALEVGNEIWLTGTDGEQYRLEITEFLTDYTVTVRPMRSIPSASGLRATATSSWSRAVDELTGLDHLEGKEVGVFADGYVVANPNNEDYGTALTVEDGALTLPAKHAVIHVGLPYISDIETLDIDTAGGETMIDKKKAISKVTMHVQKTRGVWAGAKAPEDDEDDPLEGLAELKVRESEAYSSPVDLATGVVDLIIEPHWNSNGRVFIRQIDPLPMTVLSIAPSGLIPFRGGG